MIIIIKSLFLYMSLPNIQHGSALISYDRYETARYLAWGYTIPPFLLLHQHLQIDDVFVSLMSLRGILGQC